MREVEKLAYRSPFPPGFRQLRQERASVRLEGVPQILPQVHALLSRGRGLHGQDSRRRGGLDRAVFGDWRRSAVGRARPKDW